MINTAAN
jgi:hypothetical protein